MRGWNWIAASAAPPRSEVRAVEMVVEFDRVASDTELDPATFGALLTVDHDLASKGVMGFLTKKAHDSRGAEASDGGMDEVLVDTSDLPESPANVVEFWTVGRRRPSHSGDWPTSMRSHFPPGILAPRSVSLRYSCSWA